MNLKDLIKKVLHYEGSSLQKRRQMRTYLKFRQEKGRLLKLVGKDLLKTLNKCADSLGFTIWLEFGTLLGAYREHSFIAHDFDLDVGMFINDYTAEFEKVFKENGFNIKRKFFQVLPDGNRRLSEVTLTYKDFDVDIFMSYYFDNKRYVYVSSWESDELTANNIYRLKEYTFPNVVDCELVEIDGTEFFGPTSITSVLETIYGPSYMIPDPTWETPKSCLNVRIVPLSEMKSMMEGNW